MFFSEDLASESRGTPSVSISDLARLGLAEPYARAALVSELVQGVSLTPAQEAEVYQAFCQQQQIRDVEGFKTYAKARLLEPQAMEALIRQPLKLQILGQREFGNRAEARFLQRKAQLDRVVYSLLRLQEPGLARELYLRIDAGEANFADLAAEYAEGPEKATRGIVGPVPLAQAHPALAERLRTAPPGLVLEPFQIKPFWLVVRLESITPASFDGITAARMTQELCEQWISEQVERRLAALRSQLPKSMTSDARSALCPSTL